MGQASLLALRGFTQVGLAASLRACSKDSRISSWTTVEVACSSKTNDCGLASLSRR